MIDEPQIESEGEAEPAPAEPPPSTARRRPRVPLMSSIVLPDMGNPLEINRYAHALLGVTLQQVVADPGIDEHERRKLIADITSRMPQLTPQSVMAAAAAAQNAQRDDRTRGEGPRPEPRRHAPTAAPASSAGSRTPALRGRPRKL